MSATDSVPMFGFSTKADSMSLRLEKEERDQENCARLMACMLMRVID